MVKDYTEFAKQLQQYHLNKPKLSLDFEDILSNEVKEKWQAMDKAILELIWKVNPKGFNNENPS